MKNSFLDPGEYKSLNACVGKNGGPYNFKDYSIGYFEAGNRLFKSIVEDDRLIDLLFYPFVYMFRHGVELGLKHLIVALIEIKDSNEKSVFNHRLSENWNNIKIILFKDHEPEIIDSTKVIEEAIINFEIMDPKSEAFRYPISKAMDHYLQDYERINIGVVFEKMSEVKNSFEFLFNYVEQIYIAKIEHDHYRKMVEAEIAYEMTKILPDIENEVTI